MITGKLNMHKSISTDDGVLAIEYSRSRVSNRNTAYSFPLLAFGGFEFNAMVVWTAET